MEYENGKRLGLAAAGLGVLAVCVVFGRGVDAERQARR